jgi:hypothetical protein
MDALVQAPDIRTGFKRVVVGGLDSEIIMLTRTTDGHGTTLSQ